MKKRPGLAHFFKKMCAIPISNVHFFPINFPLVPGKSESEKDLSKQV